MNNVQSLYRGIYYFLNQQEPFFDAWQWRQPWLDYLFLPMIWCVGPILLTPFAEYFTSFLGTGAVIMYGVPMLMYVVTLYTVFTYAGRQLVHSLRGD